MLSLLLSGFVLLRSGVGAIYSKQAIFRYLVLYFIQKDLAILAVPYGLHILCDIPFHNSRFQRGFSTLAGNRLLDSGCDAPSRTQQSIDRDLLSLSGALSNTPLEGCYPPLL